MARTGSDEIRVGSNLVEQSVTSALPVKPLRNDVANPTSIRAAKRRLARAIAAPFLSRPRSGGRIFS